MAPTAKHGCGRSILASAALAGTGAVDECPPQTSHPRSRLAGSVSQTPSTDAPAQRKPADSRVREQSILNASLSRYSGFSARALDVSARRCTMVRPADRPARRGGGANRVSLLGVSAIGGDRAGPRRPLMSTSSSKMRSYFLSYKLSAQASTARHSGRTKPRSAA